MNPLRMSYRGYSWSADELALFREFKRDGAVSLQAQPERYAVDFDSKLNARLWKRTRYGRDGHAREMMVASMPRRFALYIHAT